MTLAKLILIICMMESNNNPDAIGDSGRAHGVLQIHKIMVRECNRLGGNFTYTDRMHPVISKQMATVYFSPRVKDVNNLTEIEIEDCLKAWNGGTNWRKGNQDNLNNYYARFTEFRR